MAAATSVNLRLATPAADDVPPPPDSGVRDSVSRLGAVAPTTWRDSARAALGSAPESEASRDLTYSMFTVAELGSHIVATHRAAAPPPPAIAFPDVVRAAGSAARAVGAWRRSPAPRRPLREACAFELATLGAVTRAVLRGVAWRRFALGALGAVGCIVAFLGVVLVVAELTDDVKPGRLGDRPAVTAAMAARTASTTSTAPALAAAPEVASSSNGPAVAPAAPPPAAAAVSVPAAVEATPAFEVGEAARPAKKAKKTKKKHRVTAPERFVP